MNSSTNIVAKAYHDAATSYSKMSTPERTFYNEGYILLKDTVAASVNIEVLLYEWMTFNVPGGKYTPDFFVIFSDGTMAFIEVKQEATSKSGKKYYAGRSSYRDSRSKLRATAELNPWFKFYMAVYSRDGWRLEDIIPSRGTEYMEGRNDRKTT
jgi:hypothetical protein